jgi:hypothetical protein
LEQAWRGGQIDEETSQQLLAHYFRGGRFTPGQVVQVASVVRFARAMRDRTFEAVFQSDQDLETRLNDLVTFAIPTSEILSHLLALERSTDPMPLGSLMLRLARGEPTPAPEPLFGYRDCPHCKGEGVVTRPSDGRTFDCPFCEERYS